ncbi:MAG: hypothetical protein Q9183_001212 [Haloplaca sp. 2 TL-2023]
MKDPPRRQPSRASRKLRPPEPLSPGEEPQNSDQRHGATKEDILPSVSDEATAGTEQSGDTASGHTIGNARPHSPMAPSHKPGELLASLPGIGSRRSGDAISTLSPDTPAKKLKFQPKSALRRSKEEREATERQEAARLQARLEASGPSTSNLSSRGDHSSRASGRAGPISNRWQSERYAGAGASGFLGGATPAEDKRQREAAWTRGRGGGHTLMLNRQPRENTAKDATTKVKKEPGQRKAKANTDDKDDDGDVVMGSSGKRKSARVKKEQPESIHEESDDDLFELGPHSRKINIERINLVSDDELSGSGSDANEKGKSKERDRTPRSLGSSLMRPIRIDRHEHVERVVGVNTEASSAASAKIRKRAKAKGMTQEDLSLHQGADLRVNGTGKSKGKRRGRDVEFIKNERIWQGVYQDDEDVDGPVTIKQEPKETEDEMVIEDERLQGTALSQDLLRGDSGITNQNDTINKQSGTTSAPDAPKGRKRRRKARIPKISKERRPNFQTEEDRKEWEIAQEDIAVLREELRGATAVDKQGSDTAMNTDSKDKMTSPKREEQVGGRNEGLVYLFQLPPLLPDLHDPLNPPRKSDPLPAKEEKSQEKKESKDDVSKPDDSKNSKDIKSEETSIKIDPDAPTLPSSISKLKHAIPPSDATSTDSVALVPGTIGTISLGADGKPSATWSSTLKMELGRATDYGALQELVLMKSGNVEVERGGRRRKRDKKMGQKEWRTGFKEEKAWAVGQPPPVGMRMGCDWGWLFGENLKRKAKGKKRKR